MDEDFNLIMNYLDVMRKNIESLPEDPLCIIPENHGSLDEEYSEKDEIGIHHPWPKSRFGRVKEKRSIEVNISKKFENAYHHCFCNMSVPEIGIYLKEVFCTKNDKIWTWGELKALRSIIIYQMTLHPF